MAEKPNGGLSIALVSDSALDFKSGSTVAMARLAHQLVRRGHRVLVVTSTCPGKPDTEISAGMVIKRFPSLPIPKSQGQFRLGLTLPFQLVKLFKQQKVDIVHLGIPLLLSVSAVVAAKKLKLPIIYHSQSQPENITFNLGWLGKIPGLHWLLVAQLKWFCTRADKIISLTQFAQQELQRYIPLANSTVIGHGVDTRYFGPKERGTLRAHLLSAPNLSNLTSPLISSNQPSSPNSVVLFYVGRLNVEKNVDTLIRAVAELIKQGYPVSAVIIGDGPDRVPLEKLVHALNLNTNVTFMGRVSDEVLLAAYQTFDILVHPSLVELEGLTVLEAMACGKPVVVANSPTSSASSFVEGNGYVFAAKNVQDLVEQLVPLITDKNVRQKLGHKSRQLAVQHYEASKNIDKVEQLYNLVINGKQ